MKNKRTIAGIILGISTCLFTMSLNAQPRGNKQQGQKPPTFSELLKKMDANEDEKLSEDEVKGPLKEGFAKIDINEDGFITEKEFKKAPKPKREKQQQ